MHTDVKFFVYIAAASDVFIYLFNEFCREANLKQIQSMRNEITKLQTHLEESNANEQARITPVLEALEKTRQENEALARSLDEVLKANAFLKDELRKLQVCLQYHDHFIRLVNYQFFRRLLYSRKD